MGHPTKDNPVPGSPNLQNPPQSQSLTYMVDQTPPTKSKPLSGPHKPHKTPQITIPHLRIEPDTP